MKITIIADNYVDKSSYLAEHGFSCFIETADFDILFDTGQGDAFINNLKLLNIKHADFLALSHGHYDHTGGLSRHLYDCAAITTDIYASRYIFDNHLRKNPDGSFDFNGFGSSRDEISDNFKLHLNTGFTQIAENVFLSGTIDREINFDADALLYAEIDSHTRKDMFRDEQYMIIREEDGIHLISGCTHCGAENLLRHAKKLFPDDRIISLTGGLHLYRSTQDDINSVIEFLEKEDIKIIATGHCTGIEAIFQMKSRLGDKVIFTKAGMEIRY
ncbi:MAG: MBL fold metallo-hydrolase [Deferribacterales bacterium]